MILIVAEAGHFGIVKILLRRDGLDVNNPNMNGRTPIMAACDKGQPKYVKAMLACPRVININNTNKKDKTRH